MVKYFHHFGLDRDPFLDTVDPFFYCESVAALGAKRRILSSIEQSRGLSVILGEPGTGKTSLSTAVEQELLTDDSIVLGKILDPTFASEIEFLISVGRVFGFALPPRSSAALKNALKNFFFDTAVLENRTPVLIIDEAQNLNDASLEALRMLLNYQIPQKKLLNILLFGQSELERRIVTKQNLADRVDLWVRLEPLDAGVTQSMIEYRLSRAGLASGQRIFSDEARDLLYRATGGLPRRITTLAHAAMVEAADRGSSGVFEDHVRSAALNRGLTIAPPPAPATVTPQNGEPPARTWFERLIRRNA
ncbi:MAG: AAA family ATPase [Candidatus Eremiobacteraeota bacterium]|nr:AAA family ATPase [Candidatus Eremiobacteraeota bacterium]